MADYIMKSGRHQRILEWDEVELPAAAPAVQEKGRPPQESPREKSLGRQWLERVTGKSRGG
ncbi:hypothetical protein LAJ19_21215 (plasmid) [Deinococcus taeanensis]|uniref:hypothetical protein n=1 Tax=Deinococcus taeanensis TaxID=2737050 RepID=UPI001CDB5FF6|nr:hypothetical protein [Deinococcus taeanensis]UBV45312.1 hypothetical protein LAJ19_21215 [Deinococcus taeanensis]